MDESSSGNESLIARIHQLEHERDELHKDIEQLCMQQAGPGYLGVATRLHFQRTAGLEQEIETLKKKLAASTREILNLREELSETYHVKSQLADLHSAEVAKNTEAEKQVKFFQGCVAAAFSERDSAIMEAEKSKEKEELLSQELNMVQTRIEGLKSEILQERELSTQLQMDVEKQEKQNKTFKKVIDKFYDIRRHSDGFEDMSYEDKCECLLKDSTEVWSFHDPEETSTSKQMVLEEEIETLRLSLDNLQYQLRVGVQIENHLQKRIHSLERDKRTLDEKIKKGISTLLGYHSQHKSDIMKILDEGYSFIKSTADKVEEKFRQLELVKSQELGSPQSEDLELRLSECRDVHVSPDAGSDYPPKGKEEPSLASRLTPETGVVSEALAQALQEKVAALLLLSQQEERYLLERNVHAAIQKKMEELQRNLLQVTNEKVKALMELAQLKQKYQLLQGKVSQEVKQGNSSEKGDKKMVQERDGRIKNLLKSTYLNRWVGGLSSEGSNAEDHLNCEGIFSTSKQSDYEVASVKIENATLKESLESMEHLTSSIHRLRLSLVKVSESFVTEGTNNSSSVSLDHIIYEAKLVRTALGSSLPISWSAELDSGRGQNQQEVNDDVNSSFEKVDFVSAAGFEMVELLIFAAQVLKDRISSMLIKV